MNRVNYRTINLELNNRIVLVPKMFNWLPGVAVFSFCAGEKSACPSGQSSARFAQFDSTHWTKFLALKYPLGLLFLAEGNSP
jgi:hypothetical protein